MTKMIVRGGSAHNVLEETYALPQTDAAGEIAEVASNVEKYMMDFYSKYGSNIRISGIRVDFPDRGHERKNGHAHYF